ncbi:hypothetical protein AVEN_3190-1 [Araneus ventricosus]|uniref:Uncharacterized protein n=1 Tax=Araneus ventricosus TaxID=182803 RepID=A0A4Y2VNG3_ARAVE|nr:hypothetical protein AVEN_3190-1 [Araneus ventricosus]
MWFAYTQGFCGWRGRALSPLGRRKTATGFCHSHLAAEKKVEIRDLIPPPRNTPRQECSDILEFTFRPHGGLQPYRHLFLADVFGIGALWTQNQHRSFYVRSTHKLMISHIDISFLLMYSA